ncbi:hypothetical protein D3P04_13160 [Paracoccus onubensis]|uniref:Transposase n=1 Tax=Paracoccus onubensis TaxID=1675788 RepID=A0A418SUJ6_9RHOB|nr:hypothetical protein D3P04_13160 [Paracoccus onubensis]
MWQRCFSELYGGWWWAIADVARRHDTTRWQVYDWRKQLRNGKLALPESVSALPMFAELVVEEPASVAVCAG